MATLGPTHCHAEPEHTCSVRSPTSNSRRRRRCWTSSSSCRPKRAVLGGVSLLMVCSILASRFRPVGAGLLELSLPYAQENRATAMAIDRDGNLLVGGCTVAGGGSATRAATFAFNSVAFVAKYAQTGEQLWRRELTEDGAAGDCSSVSIATGQDATVFVAGTTIVTTVSVGAHDESSSSDTSDIFVSKLTSSGEILWRKSHGTSQQDEATAIKVDPSGAAVYVTGFSGGDMTAMLNSSKEHSLSKSPSSYSSNCERWTETTSSSLSEPLSSTDQECLAGFVLKLETLAGDAQWVHQVTSQSRSGGGDGDHRVFSVDVDEHGHVVVVGDTKGNLQQLNDSAVANASSAFAANDTTRPNHAGDLFVRKLDEFTGESIWTTQIGATGSIAELCRLSGESKGSDTMKKRGNCGIALVPPSAGSSEEPGDESSSGYLYITGTTFGLISSVDQDIGKYATLCSSDAKLQAIAKTKKTTRLFEGTAAPAVRTFIADCAYQTVFAKLKVADGRVEWVRQVVSASRNSAEGIVRVPVNADEMSPNSTNSNPNSGDSDIVILGLADPGFLSSSDSMEQLFVMRVATTTATEVAAIAPGESKWIKETGLSGEDRALGIATGQTATTSGQDPLFIMGFGNRESRNSGNTLWSAYVRKVNTLSGEARPFCVDAFALQTNSTIVQQLKSERVVVSVTVERSNELCGGSSSVAYVAGIKATSGPATAVLVELVARPGVDFVASKGLVRFAPGQKTATIAVDVLPAQTQTSTALKDGSEQVPVRSFVFVLESLAQETTVVVANPFKMEISIQMATATSVTQFFNSDDTEGNGGSNGGEAADGHFWRRLSRMCALAIGLLLVLVVAFGRFCGNACSLRKAKAFQYKRMKSPRASASTRQSSRGLSGLEPVTRRLSSTRGLDVNANANANAAGLNRDRSLGGGPGTHHEASGLAGAIHEEEEDEELRAHLDEIQQLNDSLEALIHNSITSGAQRRKPSVDGNGEVPQLLSAKPTAPGVVTPILTNSSSSSSSSKRSKPRKKTNIKFINARSVGVCFACDASQPNSAGVCPFRAAPRSLSFRRLQGLLVEHDLAVVLDVLAVAVRSPERLGDRRVILEVELAEDRLERLGGLLRVVERHLGEDVVRHVRVRDVVQHAVQVAAERAVDRAKRAAQPVPLAVAEVRHERVRVLQVRDEHEVGVDDEVRDEVELDHGRKSHGVDEEAERHEHGAEEHVAEDDHPALAVVEHHGVWVEVRARLAVVLGRTRGIEEEVAGHPADREHEHDLVEVVERRVLHVVLPRRGVDRARDRHEHLIVLAAACVRVVAAVRDAPAVVRHEQRRVQEEADDVVHGLGRAVRLVAALVRDHPDAREVRALEEPVERPERELGIARGRIDKRRTVEERRADERVLDQVVRRVHEAALEAVRRDGRAQVLDGELRQRERQGLGRAFHVRVAGRGEHALDLLVVGLGVRRGGGGRGVVVRLDNRHGSKGLRSAAPSGGAEMREWLGIDESCAPPSQL